MLRIRIGIWRLFDPWNNFYVKILKFYDADSDQEIFFDPGSGMEKNRIRDKHPLSLTLTVILVSNITQ